MNVPTLKDLADELDAIHLFTDQLMQIRLHVWHDGWQVFFGSTEDDEVRPDGVWAHGCIPGPGVEWNAQREAAVLLCQITPQVEPITISSQDAIEEQVACELEAIAVMF